MRLSGLTGFVILGALGFGAGGAIAVLSMLWPISLSLSVLVGGAVGGASLGLALRDWRRAMILAMLGTLGLTAGIFATLGFASYFAYSPAPLGALVGAVGFGIGFLAGDLLRASFPVIKGLGSIVVAGMIGGASLGATLGILETRRPAGGRGQRVR